MSAVRSDIQDVILDWIADRSGFASSKVVWDYQGQPKLVHPFIDLRIFSDRASVKKELMKEIRVPEASNASYLSEVVGTSTIVLSVFCADTPGNSAIPWDTLEPIRLSVYDPAVSRALQRSQLDTIEVTTVLNLTAYTVTVDGVAIVITSDATATAEEIRDALVVAINADTDLVGITAANAVAVDQFTIESTGFAGQPFDSVLDSKLTLETHVGAVDLVFREEFGINNVSRMQETNYESRAQIDFKFALADNLVNRDTETIEEVHGDLDGHDFVVP